MEGGYNWRGLSEGSSGRSRKGKKGGGGGSEKPVKQPQRGLGVAQLEKIRLQSQMSEYVNSSSSSSFHSDLDLDDHSKVETMMRSPSSAPSSSSSNVGSASASSSLFSPHHHHHHPGSMMGYGDATERRSFNYTTDQYNWPNYSSTRSQEGSASFNYYAPPTTVTLPLFEQSVEQTATQKRSQHDRSSSMGSISTRLNIHSENSNEQEEEVDLELRLSL